MLLYYTVYFFVYFVAFSIGNWRRLCSIEDRLATKPKQR